MNIDTGEEIRYAPWMYDGSPSPAMKKNSNLFPLYIEAQHKIQLAREIKQREENEECKELLSKVRQEIRTRIIHEINKKIQEAINDCCVIVQIQFDFNVKQDRNVIKVQEVFLLNKYHTPHWEKNLWEAAMKLIVNDLLNEYGYKKISYNVKDTLINLEIDFN